MNTIPLDPRYSVKPHDVIVDFGKAIPSDEQGPVLLQMEMSLRERGIPAEVYKRTMPDDSKLRLKMTDDLRAKL